MFGRVTIGLLALSFTGCATQQPASDAVAPPLMSAPAIETGAAPSTPPPLATRALPSAPIRKQAPPPRQALADPPAEPEAPPIIEPTKAPPLPDDDAFVEQIIEESRARYPGPCGCPYDRDRAGRKCGERSAYSRAGGYSLYCYARDVPVALIERRRSMAAR